MTQILTTIQKLDLGGEVADVRLVKFEGQLDETNVDAESKKIYEIFEGNATKVILIFDMTDLTYMNSKSIGYMTDWYNHALETGGKVLIASPRDNILDILKVVGLTQIIKIYATVEEAKLDVMNV